LPALAEENPRVVEALLGLAEAARAGAAAGETPAGIGRGAAQAIRRLRVRGGSGVVDVAGHRRVEVSYGQLRIGEPAEPGAAPATCRPPAACRIDGPGQYPWPGGQLAVRIDGPGSDAQKGGEDGVDDGFDAEQVAWPLYARPRRPGDRMRPRGGRGSRKLSDLMIDAKLARDRRDLLPVVATADDQVLYVPGLRPAELARAGATTQRVLHIAFAPSSRNPRADRTSRRGGT
jgi:tRNA(Ile)-lysidine synthase